LKQFKEMQRMMSQMGLGRRLKKGSKKGKKGGRVTPPKVAALPRDFPRDMTGLDLPGTNTPGTKMPGGSQWP
jgi:hypothetical protein